MTDRIHKDSASIEDERLGIMEDLINRYLANEIDLRQLTDAVTISRLSEQWEMKYSAGWLREFTFHHLFFFARGDWPESTLRESLAFLLHEAIDGNFRWRTPMVDQQWIALLKAGHVPPGVGHEYHTMESILRMAPEQLAELRRAVGLDG